MVLKYFNSSLWLGDARVASKPQDRKPNVIQINTCNYASLLVQESTNKIKIQIQSTIELKEGAK